MLPPPASPPSPPAPPPVVVRAATAADRGALQRLLVADVRERGPSAQSLDDVEDVVERVVALLLATGSTAWALVAQRHGMTVGVLLANPFLSARRGGPALRVDTVYVPPASRRKGVGRALLAHAAEEAHGYGIVAVEAEVPAGDAAGEALCRSVGVTAVASA